MLVNCHFCGERIDTSLPHYQAFSNRYFCWDAKTGTGCLLSWLRVEQVKKDCEICKEINKHLTRIEMGEAF